jgi:hypothetical protein
MTMSEPEGSTVRERLEDRRRESGVGQQVGSDVVGSRYPEHNGSGDRFKLKPFATHLAQDANRQ